MPFGWLNLFRAQDFDETPQRRLANRPHRGKRADVKASRKAARKNRR